MVPAARHTGARWTYRYSEWRYATASRVLNTAQNSPETAGLGGVIACDRAQLAEDLIEGEPDVIAIYNAEVRARETADPAIAGILAGYKPAGTVDRVTGKTECWSRH